jgi:hypothetical protein
MSVVKRTLEVVAEMAVAIREQVGTQPFAG